MAGSSNSFNTLTERLYSAGKVENKLLSRSRPVGANRILQAQKESTLYSVKFGEKDSEASRPTLGKNWFNLEPLELDSKLKQDIKMIQMRNYLDPKRFYKNPDKPGKIVHVGTVIEGPSEFKSSRMTRKERKQSIVEEILSDKKIRDYSKGKFLDIQKSRMKKSKKPFKSQKHGKSRKKLRELF